MTDTDRKKKTVILRLSDSEYEELRLHYRSFGVRSISEFASLALQRTLAEPSPAVAGFETMLAELEHRVRDLEAAVSLLTQSNKAMG